MPICLQANYRRQQQGLTLLEVLIALSIFAMIGVASYRVLFSVIDAQKVGETHSRQLARVQKSLLLIDRDLQQLIDRDIRVGDDEMASLVVDSAAEYPLEFSRAGRANPIQLPRSALQRVAYSVGQRPQSGSRDSASYRDERSYLLRHYWKHLDRHANAEVTTQALLPDIDSLEITVIDEDGNHSQWPRPPSKKKTPARLIGIHLSMEHAQLGRLERLYRVR